MVNSFFLLFDVTDDIKYWVEMESVWIPISNTIIEYPEKKLGQEIQLSFEHIQCTYTTAVLLYNIECKRLCG